MKIRACLLSLLTVCMVSSISEAKVCFLVGTTGQCGKEAQIKDLKDCYKLGYTTPRSSCDTTPVSGLGISKMVIEGPCGDYIKKCVCNNAYYNLGGETDAAKYVYSDKCPNQDKYHKRVCKTTYKYVKSADASKFTSSGMSSNGYNAVTTCSGDRILGTTSQCTDKYGSTTITRSTQCLCDTNIYKYTQSMIDNNSGKPKAFSLTGGNCTDDDGLHTTAIVCSWASDGEGKWKTTCDSSTEKDTASKTYVGVTCHLCVPKTCQEKNSKWYSATQKSGLANQIRFSWTKEGSGKDGDCWHTTGCAAGYVTKAQRETSVYTYGDGVTIGDYTCYAANGCNSAGYVNASNRNTSIFTYGEGQTSGSITCHNVTGCAGNYVLSTAKNTTYFTYNSGTSQGGKTCHTVTGCATNYVLSTAKDTTHFTYGSEKTQGGKTCSAATGCASAYSTTANGTVVAQTKNASGDPIKCYEKAAATCEDMGYSSYKYKDLMREGTVVAGVKDKNNKSCYEHVACQQNDYLTAVFKSDDNKARWCMTTKGGVAKVISTTSQSGNISSVTAIWLKAACSYNGSKKKVSSGCNRPIVLSKLEANKVDNKITKAQLQTYQDELKVLSKTAKAFANNDNEITMGNYADNFDEDEGEDLFFGTSMPLGIWTTSGLCYHNGSTWTCITPDNLVYYDCVQTDFTWSDGGAYGVYEYYTYKCTEKNDISIDSFDDDSDTQVSAGGLTVPNKYVCHGARGEEGTCDYNFSTEHYIVRGMVAAQYNRVIYTEVERTSSWKKIPQLGVFFGIEQIDRNDALKHN